MNVSHFKDGDITKYKRYMIFFILIFQINKNISRLIMLLIFGEMHPIQRNDSLPSIFYTHLLREAQTRT